MIRAILSDIHGNLEALTAVLDDARQQGASSFICLGDVIGYGPNPRECIDQVMRFDVCILGNHDLGALFDPEGFSSGAERAIFWTRQQLEHSGQDLAAAARRIEFLAQLPRNVQDAGLMFVHGSARNPLNEYVFPEDIYNARKMDRIFTVIPRHCFQGHTHVPGVFTDNKQFFSPGELCGEYELGEGKVMINTGSVGQPRDGDARSSYVLLDHQRVEFRRVEYPLEETAEKIYAIEELDNFLGDRLKEGR